MNDLSSLAKELNRSSPKLVFLSGKTSTGKTTIANILKVKYSCAVIELDAVVAQLESPSGTNKYLEAYTKRESAAFLEDFVSAVKQRIERNLKSHPFVIIEGAIAVSETLKEIIDEWKNEFLFIYLDIKHRDVYIDRLTSRFVNSSQDNGNGLPGLFWEEFSPEILQQYYRDRKITTAIADAIERYAIASIKASEARLEMFAKEFEHIVKVEV